MKKPLFAEVVKCSCSGPLLAAMALLGSSSLQAQPSGQMPPAGYQTAGQGYPQAPAYPQSAPNYATGGGAYDPAAMQDYQAGNGGYAPGNYQPPTMTAQSQVRKGSKNSRPANYTPATPGNYVPMTIEAKVDKLAQNDDRQDQRLHHLERDVSNLKAGSVAAADPNGGHYISKPNTAPMSRLHTVREGETLWRIAAKYNTSVNAIRVANHMSGDTVAVGQSLAIPGEGGGSDAPPPSAPIQSAPEYHVVRKGQKFEDIAKMYKVSPDSLARANPTAYPDRLLVGEKLKIPGRKSAPAATPGMPKYDPSQYVKSNNNSGNVAGSGTHTVRAGESLGAIAKSHGITTARLVAANKIKNPDVVEVGRVLVIPGGGKTAAPQAPAPTKKQTAEPNKMVARRDQETIPLPGAGMPSAPQAPAKMPAPMMPAPEAAPRKSPMPTGAHRGVVAYRLERGDDLDSVATMFSTTPDKIRELNKLPSDAKVKEGDELVVPAMGPVSVN